MVVGVHHVFFIYKECLSVSQERDGGWICGSSKSRVPGRKKEGEREGGTEKKEGGQLRRYKRCSVFSGKRARDVGRGAHCLT